MAGTININKLLTEDILLSDFLVKADENGLATKTTVQELSNTVSAVGDVSFKGRGTTQPSEASNRLLRARGLFDFAFSFLPTLLSSHR